MKKKSIKAYRKYYEDPIAVREGELVNWIQKDSEWAGWTWCIHLTTHKAGWVPNSHLELSKQAGVARILKNYSAAELNAEADESFEILREESGWYWCRNSLNIEGWLPTEIF